MSDRCTVCSGPNTWAVENAYLTEGSGTARSLCSELGISQSAYYRHIKSHLRPKVDHPPDNPNALDWTRATINIASAVDAYRIVSKPELISDIGIVVGQDDKGQFIELFIIHSGGLDQDAVESMVFNIGMTVENTEISKGISPITRMSAKLHTHQIMMGLRRPNDDK